MDVAERRKFLGCCIGGLGVASAVAALYPIYRYLAPGFDHQKAAQVSLPMNELREGEATFIQYAGAAAVVVRTKGGSLHALSAVCTHLGCIVQWQSERQQFLCPCHGGQFSSEGTVLAGPPPKPLRKLPVTVANGTITIG
jgi:cytochrome b6-f complex iron-sulfur subunit